MNLVGERSALFSLPERCAALGRSVGLVGSRRFVVPWQRVQASLGTALPNAYRAFIEYFGPGRFSQEFEYLTPGIGNSAYDLAHQVHDEHRHDTRAAEMAPNALAGDLALYPETNGLLRFGALPEDLVYWQTGASDPNDWPIVIPDPAYRQCSVRFAGDFIDFVNALLDQDAALSDIQYDPGLMAVFVPGDGNHHGGRHTALRTVSYFHDDRP